MQDSTALRQSIIDGCLWMQSVGLNQGTSGNISLRVDDAMLITPSAVAYADMTPKMICKLPLNGAPNSDQNPSTEWQFHQAALNARPDANAIVHAHPVHATAVAIGRRAIPAVHYMIAAFGGPDVPCTGYARFGTSELSQMIADAIQSRHGCLMANHGALTLGDTLAKSLWRMQELETLAQMFLLAEQSGAMTVLSTSEINETLTAFEGYGLQSVAN